MNGNEIELYCPLCGTMLELQYSGNSHTKLRKLRIKCPSCRIERTDATLRHDFEWLENKAIEFWTEVSK